MKIALVEDDNCEADVLTKYLNRYGQDKQVKLEITRYGSAEEFLKAYKNAYFSIVFMDIDLPGIRGLDAARALRRQDDCVTIIFVTKMAQYAQKGYEGTRSTS